MKIKLMNLIILLLLLIGLVLVFYLTLRSRITRNESEKVIDDFEQVSKEFRGNDYGDDCDEDSASRHAQSQQLYDYMQTYNKEIYENGQANLKDKLKSVQ